MEASELSKRIRSSISLIEQDSLDAMLRRSREDVIQEAGLAQIEIVDTGEPLVEIRAYAPQLKIEIQERRLMYSGETLYLREGVALALDQVSRKILPYQLKVWDAFRPLEYQKRRYDSVLAQTRAANPTWSEKQVKDETFIRVWPPDSNPKNPPAHLTGGAIDLTMLDEAGVELDMGNRYGEHASTLYTNVTCISAEQRANRVLLITAMASEGFMSFPGEWWHFSRGDREWAAYSGLAQAFYGGAKNPHV